MNVMRSLVVVSIGCGTCLAAGQKESALPAPMTLAINRLARPDTSKAPDIKLIQVDPETMKSLVIESGSWQCSIPLAQAKVPQKDKKFFIQQKPVGQKSPDSMPVLKGNVCPPVEAK